MYRYLILFFSLILFFVPLFSWSASFVPVSFPCSSWAMYDDSDVSRPVTCPYCPGKGTTAIKLNWQVIDRSFTNQHCFLSCADKDGKNCGQIYYKNKEGFPSVGPEGPDAVRLKNVDEIYLTDFKDGQSYVASCCEKCLSSTPREECSFPWVCKLGTIESSIKAEVKKECREPCEVSFQSIVDKLNDNQPVTITESDFSSWGTRWDSSDSAGWPSKLNLSYFGSGDVKDIKKFVESIQICQNIPPEEDFSPESVVDALTVMSPIIQASNSFLPIRVTTRLFKIDLIRGIKLVTTHEVISLGTNLKNLSDLNNLDATSTDNFWIEVMDSNSWDGEKPVIYRLTCHKEFDNKYHFLYIKCFSDVHNWNNFFTLRRGDLGGEDSLAGQCVRPRPTEWLRENGQFIDNWSGETPGTEKGVCWGLANFFIKVACYGTFSGVDYHPDDMKYVGTDCDANHMPLRKTSFVGSDLVASVRLLIGKLFFPI